MTVSTRTTRAISPVPQAGGVRTRSRQAASRTDDAPTGDAKPVGTALARHADPQRQRRNEPVKPHVPGTLAAQLIAQKLPGKSERRLARYFPERVHRAYLQAARTVPTTRTLHSA